MWRRLWLAATVDAFGSWLLVTAVPIEVFARTGSPGSTGLALAVEAGPALLFGPWAGALVDRLPRVRVLLAADLVAAAGVALMLGPGVGFLYAGLAVESVAVCFLAPGVQAAMPLVAPDLAAATAALAVSQSTWRVLGPLIGAAATAAGWFPIVVLTDVATYLAAGALIAGLTLPVTSGASALRATTTARAGFAGQPPADDIGVSGRPVAPAGVTAGLRLATGSRVLRALLVGGWLFWTANAALTALLVPLIVERLHAGGGAVGYLVTGLGVGYLAGSALTRRLLVRGPQVIAVAYALVGACFLVLVTAPTLPVAVVAATLSGVPGAVVLAATGLCLQTNAPAALRGRLTAAFRTSDAVAAVGGALAAPGLVALIGLDRALVTFAATVPVAALVTATMLRGGPSEPAARAV